MRIVTQSRVVVVIDAMVGLSHLQLYSHSNRDIYKEIEIANNFGWGRHFSTRVRSVHQNNWCGPVTIIKPARKQWVFCFVYMGVSSTRLKYQHIDVCEYRERKFGNFTVSKCRMRYFSANIYVVLYHCHHVYCGKGYACDPFPA